MLCRWNGASGSGIGFLCDCVQRRWWSPVVERPCWCWVLNLDWWDRVVEANHFVEYGGWHSENEKAVNSGALGGIDGGCIGV